MSSSELESTESLDGECESTFDETTYVPRESASRRARRRKKRKLTDILVCLDNCKYDVVANVVTSLKYKIVDESEDWNLYWQDRSAGLERVLRLNPYQRVNHFPGMSEIARKDNLARNLMRMYKLHSEQYDFFPLTWVIPQELSDFRAFLSKKKTKTTFICKPDASCQGKGIVLTRNPIDDVTEDDNCVVQEYLAKPYLINGTKFDLRIYALIYSVDPLIIYLYNEGLGRFCTEKYVEPSSRNLENAYMHLTNYAINKHNETFVQNNQPGDSSMASKWSLSGVMRYLASEGHDIVSVWNGVKDGIIKTLLAIQPTLAHTYRTVVGATGHNNQSLCFEILGFDFILDHRLKPLLLEVNHSPSFSCDSTLDLEIKTNLITDSLKLIGLSKSDKKIWKKTQKLKFKERLYGKKTAATINEKEKNTTSTPSKAAKLPQSFGGYELIYSQTSDLNESFADLVVAPTTLAETTSSRMRRENVEKMLKKREDDEKRERERREKKPKPRLPSALTRSDTSSSLNLIPKTVKSISKSNSQSELTSPLRPSSSTSQSVNESQSEPVISPPTCAERIYSLYLDLPHADRRIADNIGGKTIEESAERSRLYDRVVRENLLKTHGLKEFVLRLFKQGPFSHSVQHTTKALSGVSVSAPLRGGYDQRDSYRVGQRKRVVQQGSHVPISVTFPQHSTDSFKIPVLSGTPIMPQSYVMPKQRFPHQRH
ncbi:hypothetical protein RCL1_006820 [Eukaryota sp. TZLM3-RCL]